MFVASALQLNKFIFYMMEKNHCFRLGYCMQFLYAMHIRVGFTIGST